MPAPARQPRAGRAAGQRRQPRPPARTHTGSPLEPSSIRVTLLLDRQALEDLELIVRYRHGPRTRSAVVREAINWLRAKEAAWLARAHKRAEKLQREADDLRAIEREGREAWEQQGVELTVQEAIDLVVESGEL